MKIEDLINKLSEFPLEMDVCILDIVKNTEHASDGGTSAGIYKDFNIEQVFDEEELKE